MSHFRPCDRDTPYLLPPSLDDWLPRDHLARFVVDIVDQLDLSALIGRYRGAGSAAYHPAMLLALLIYGYATGTYPSRRIEQATYDSLAFRYLAANTHPDHDTLCAFRKRFLKEIEALFVQVLCIAKRGAVDLRVRWQVQDQWLDCRLIVTWNSKTREFQYLATNLPPERYSAYDVAKAYRLSCATPSSFPSCPMAVARTTSPLPSSPGGTGTGFPVATRGSAGWSSPNPLASVRLGSRRPAVRRPVPRRGLSVIGTSAWRPAARCRRRLAVLPEDARRDGRRIHGDAGTANRCRDGATLRGMPRRAGTTALLCRAPCASTDLRPIFFVLFTLSL